MSEISATEAARHFADLLDAVEHEGRHYTVVRRGRAVAHIEPVSRGRGADVKNLLREGHGDSTWASDLEELRGLLEIEDRT